jgi:hypothetical protein
MYGVPRDSSVMCAPWRPRWLRQGSAVRCPRLSAGRPIPPGWFMHTDMVAAMSRDQHPNILNAGVMDRLRSR